MSNQNDNDRGKTPEGNVAVASNPIQIDATQQSILPVNLDKESFTLAEILQCDFNEVPFLVEGLIPAESLSIIVGESDLGKSTLHTQLSLSIISGQETFLGKKINAKYKNVLIVSTEEGIRGIGERIVKQCKIIQPDNEAKERCKFLLTSSDIANKIKKELRKGLADLVVVDAFSDVYQGDMNISNKVRIFFNAYTDIIREFKCAIVFITHVGKSREGLALHKNQVLGSVGIVDKAREVLMMSRVKNKPSDRQLTIIKGNYVSEEEKKKALILKFDTETRTFEKHEDIEVKNITKDPGDIIYQEYINEIKRLRDLGLTYDRIGQELHRDKSSISRIVKNHPEIFCDNPDNDP